VLPVIIFVAVAVPLLLIAFLGIRRRSAAGERPAARDEAAAAALQEEYEDEFEQAEEYQAEWREEQHRQHPDDRLY
jgi:F0F1-type ATP synthase membrane subunit b/b'